MATEPKTPKPAKKSFGSKQQQVFAFCGLVLFLTGLVATGLLGKFNFLTSLLCITGIAVGSVIFLPRLTRNLAAYANMLLYSLFFCMSVIVFYMILQKHPLTYDATESHSFSLSSVTSNFLGSLDQPIRATAFIRDKQERLAVSRLLGEYTRYSNLFEYTVVDPFQESEAARRFSTEVHPGDLYLEKLSTGTQEMTNRIVKVGDINEEQITNGIFQLLRGKELTVYFTSGHGEPELKEDKVSAALMNRGPDMNNLEGLVTQLERNYMRVVPLRLDTRETVPADASVVVIARPRTDFQAAEVRALQNYLDNGGRVLMLLNPDIPQLGNEVRTALINVSGLAKQYGIELPSQVIMMPKAQSQGQKVDYVPVVALEGGLTVTLPKNDPFTIFPQARPVQAGSAPLNTFVEPFLQTTADAWTLPIQELQRALINYTAPKIAPKETELKTYPLGLSSTRMNPEKGADFSSKMVVIGNGDFVTTQYFLGKQEWVLFINCINWLTDTGDRIPIPKTDLQHTPVVLSPGQSRFIFILVAIAIPLLVGLGGLGYSISRRGGI